MKTNLGLKLFTALVGAVLSACSPQRPASSTIVGYNDIPETPRPVYPNYKPIDPQKFPMVIMDAGQQDVQLHNQIDIVFIIDNSDSMSSHLEEVRRNINQFVSAFRGNEILDYHISVLPIWDDTSVRKPTAPQFSPLTDEHGNRYEVGELLRAKDKDGHDLNTRFVSRNNNGDLIKTLNIGVKTYKQGGPEKEEFLTPIETLIAEIAQHATGESALALRNPSKKVFVLLTDADESKADAFDAKIKAKTDPGALLDYVQNTVQALQSFASTTVYPGSNNLEVYGALVKKGDADENKDWDLTINEKYNSDCLERNSNGSLKLVKGKTVRKPECKEGLGPDILEKFILASNSIDTAEIETAEKMQKKYILGINRGFGKELGRIGSDITKKLFDKDIVLQGGLPRYAKDDQGKERYMIEVRYGTEAELKAESGYLLVPEAAERGWYYIPKTNTIHISGDVDYGKHGPGQFQVRWQPVATR